MGRISTLLILAADVDLRRSADEREAVQLQQEHVGRGIDRAGGAVNVQRRGLDRRREALRADHLDDVARGDVLLGLEHVGEELLPGQVRLEGQRAAPPRERVTGTVLAGLFEQGDQPVDFADGVLVGLRRAGGVLEHGVDQDGDGLGDAIEDQQLVGDQEIHHRRLQVVVRRARHDRLDVVDELVADETDRAAGEPRQARAPDRIPRDNCSSCTPLRTRLPAPSCARLRRRPPQAARAPRSGPEP